MKKIYKIVFTSLCGILFVLGIFTAVKNVPTENNASAQTVALETAQIQSTYNVEQEVIFPQSVTVDYYGEQTATDGILVYPDGTIYPIVDDTFVLSQQGQYTVKYFFTYQKVRITATKSFHVYATLYNLSASNGSSVTAVTPKMNEVDMTSTEIDAMRDKKEGLIVRLYEGCTFTYNKPVNLAEVGADGLASVITFHPRASVQETVGASFTNKELVAGDTFIRLTDCYDSSKYVELVLDNSSGGKDTICYRAGTNSQEAAGIYLPDNGAVAYNTREVYYDGVRGLARFFNWGPWNFAYNNKLSPTGVTLKYDNQRGRLYVECGGDRLLVNDFRNSDIYEDNLFEGFTTGEVFVSIRSENYYSAKATRVDVLSIGQDVGSDLTLGLEGKVTEYPKYKDEIKPSIKINVEQTDKYGIYVAVGEEVVIPTANVYDLNNGGKLSVGVYRSYYGDNKFSVDIHDGKFNVTDNDVYYIEYKAIDIYGNQAIEVLKVFVEENAKGSLSVVADKLSVVSAGEEISLPKPQVFTLNDAEKLTLEISISHAQSGKQVITEAYGLQAIEALKEEDLRYRPLYSGEYTVTYRCTDNINETTFGYTVNGEASSTVVFLKKPLVNRYLIKDATYALEPLKASTFTTGAPTEKDAEVFVSFDDSAFVRVADITKLKITGNATAQLKYVCEGAEIYSGKVQIVDVGFTSTLDLKNYFQGEDFTYASGGSALFYDSNVTQGNSVLHFVNPVASDSFLFEFLITKANANIRAMNVVLTDVNQPDKKVVITYGNNDGTAYACVNDGMRVNLNLPFADDVQSYRIFYDNTNKKFIIRGAEIAFELPFSGSACYFDVELVGIDGKAGVGVKAVNNQNFNSNLRLDMNKPEISVYKSQGDYRLGDVITIYAAEFIDVLAPIDYTSKKLTVTYNGEYVRSVDGVLLDGVQNDPEKTYQIQVNALGTYRVSYVASDSLGANNKTESFYVFNVVEETAPTITLDGCSEGGTFYVKVGEKFKFGYTVEDNVSKDLVTYVIVKNRTSLVTKTYAQGEIPISRAGEFDVFVVCMDEAGNMSTAQFKLVATMEENV